MFFVGLLLGFF